MGIEGKPAGRRLKPLLAVALAASLSPAAPAAQACADEGGSQRSIEKHETDAIASTSSADEISLESAPAPGEWSKCGTAEWSVDSAGKMTIRPVDGNATGELSHSENYESWKHAKTSITSIFVQGTVAAPSDCSYLFSGLWQLESVDLSGLDVSNVETMEGMFQGCSSLKSLAIPARFDMSKVKSMANMFDGCKSLSSVDFSRLGSPGLADTSFLFRDCKAMDFSSIAGFDTSGVRNMSGMFMRCNENGTLHPADLKTANATDMSQMFVANHASSLSLKGMDTSKVSDMSKMFYGCRASSIDLSGIDTSSVTDMSWMFRDCENLSKLDLSSFNTANVRNMSNMFSGIGVSDLDLRSFDTKNATDMSLMFSKYHNDQDPDSTYSRVMPLESVDLSSFDTSNVTNMGSMFYGCTNLPSIDLKSFNTSSVENMAGMFNECTSLTRLDLGHFDLSHVKSMNSMFYKMNSLESIDLSGCDASSVESMRYMFGYCPSLREVNLSGFKTRDLTNMYCTFMSCHSLEKLDLSSFDTSSVTTFSDAFGDCPNLKEINLSSFDTSSAVDMNGMFWLCGSLESIDLSGFDTSRAKNLNGMFAGCSSLTELDVPAIETGNATDVGSMFVDCSSLTSIDLSSFDTSKATNMGGLFSGCSSLTKIDFPESFKTNLVTSMGSMFSGCSSLEELDLSSFDTSKVTTEAWITGKRYDEHNASNMFRGCSSLKKLGLSSFNTSSMTNMGGMFEGCSSLEELDLSSFNTANVEYMDKMFEGCSSLKAVSLGSRFSFSGAWDTRLCTLPDMYSKWIRTSDGASYSYDAIPNKVAATYIADESSKSSFELEEGMFAIDTSDAVYTGSMIRDRVTSSKLTPGTDYRVNYSNAVNAGTATIEIVGLGKYKGGIEKTFAILPASMEDVAVRFVPDQEWSGSAVKPKPVVKYGAQELAEGKDYTLSYKNNVDAGVATATITGIGNFSGTKDVDYKIVKAESPDPGTGGGTDPAPDPGTGGGGTDPGTGGGGADPTPTPDPGSGGGEVPAPEPQQFSITYHLDGGTNAASNPATFAAGMAVPLAAPVREGYEFQGWYADAALTVRVDEVPADASGDVELWAKWEREAPAPVFPDVDYSESSWYGKAVTYVASKGLITGYTAGDKAGLFGVGDTLTRAQLATILWRNACPDESAAYDPSSAKGETGIAGSADGQYYTAAANWAVANRVISGYDRPDGTKDFAANENVTFEQLVTILARLCATDRELASVGSDLSAFADGGDASSWSRGAFAWAAKKGLVEGYDTASGKLLAPTEDVVRERVAVVLMRAFEMGILN